MRIIFNPLTGKFDYVGTTTGGGGSSANGIMVWDDGVPVGTGIILNFVGNGVQASISGSVVQVLVTGTSGGGLTHPQVMARIGLR